MPGALGAAAGSPHSRDSGAALGGARTARRPASERAGEGGRRAGPGPSCPYDRAGRRRALPSHGKRRARRGAGPGWGWSSAAARSLDPAALPACAGCRGAPAAGAPGAPAAEAPGAPAAEAPVAFPSLHASGPAAPGAGAETRCGPARLLRLLRRFPGKGTAPCSAARRGPLSHPRAGQRGSLSARGPRPSPF